MCIAFGLALGAAWHRRRNPPEAPGRRSRAITRARRCSRLLQRASSRSGLRSSSIANRCSRGRGRGARGGLARRLGTGQDAQADQCGAAGALWRAGPARAGSAHPACDESRPPVLPLRERSCDRLADPPVRRAGADVRRCEPRAAPAERRAFVQVLESATAVLLGAAIYCLTRQVFIPRAWPKRQPFARSGKCRSASIPEENALLAPASFMERGVVTNIFFLAGLAALWLGRRYRHVVWTYSGMAFTAIALFRIAFLDLLILNPVWSHQFVGELPLINGSHLPFALPIAWSVIAAREIRALGMEHYRRRAEWPGLRAAFRPCDARRPPVPLGRLSRRRQYRWTPEVYAYSAAWLLLGVGLLVAGTISKGADDPRRLARGDPDRGRQGLPDRRGRRSKGSIASCRSSASA